MKRNLTIILAGAALLALAGCSREPLAEEPGTEVLNAEIVDEALTRTSYDGTTGKFAWTAGDKIALYLVKEGQNPRTQETKVTPTTDRKGTFVYSKETGWSRTGYAVYPAAVAKSLTVNNALTLTLPAAYDLTTSTSVQLPMVAVNSGETSNLAFKAACGLLRIKCEGLTSTTVTVTLDKGITGDFAVDNPGSAPTISAAEATASNTTVTFTLPSVSTSAELNLPLPCGRYSSVSVSNGSSTKTETSPFTMDRGEGKKLHITF